jgi:hypothetical protein
MSDLGSSTKLSGALQSFARGWDGRVFVQAIPQDGSADALNTALRLK